MGRLKPSNLVSGFKVAGFYPLDSHQVLKRLPDESGDDSINESIFNDAVLNVLKENCGIRVPIPHRFGSAIQVLPSDLKNI